MKKILTILGILIIIGVFSYEQYLNVNPSTEEQSDSAIIPDTSRTYNITYLPSSTTKQVIFHSTYALSYNESYEQAEWVCYQLRKSDIVYTKRKRPFFIQDKAVSTESADWRNYKHSGYDKGHLCPAGDRKYTNQAYNETFLTSNISPQNHDFNAGIWNDLEQLIRSWVKHEHALYVVTGGVLKPGLNTIGKERVSVPHYFYKIVFKDDGETSKMIGFLIPNSNSNIKALSEYVVSIDTIEKETGIDFFPFLVDDLEHSLEETVNVKGWKFR